jgi:5-methyltetrahydropteroyltriglutamate--homocysteine methyltransferase
MKVSTDRILTTHVGSLPRPDDVSEVLIARQRGEELDSATFASTIRRAVADTVAMQAEAGVDTVSDGEMSKISYSTYITDRLTGFEGDSPRKVNLDIAPYPEFREKMARITGNQPMPRAVCVGPIAVKDRELLRQDLDNYRAALTGAAVEDAFMTAASPGVISAFQPNQYYPSHEAYLGALADAMREEYEEIVAAGFVLQLDCPDLAMARHTAFQDIDEGEFLKRAEQQVEAINHALSGVPAESVRMHLCWGNYEGPHDHDIPLEKILSIVMSAKPSAVSFEASNPRHAHEWKVWRDAAIPDDKVLIPGVIDSTTNFVEHPELVAQRIEQFAAIVGRERVLAGSDCGFGTFAGYGKMDPGIVYKKLRAQADGAAIASGRLWGK